MPPVKAPSGQAYRVIGYINDQQLIDRVETWVEHDMFGDLHVDTAYRDYKDFGGLKVPTKIVQKRGGWTFFEVSIADARANPPDLAQRLQPPAPGGRQRPASGARRLSAHTTLHQAHRGGCKINGAYNSWRWSSRTTLS
jgi:hypothetical protein